MMIGRLLREIATLLRCEIEFGIPAMPVISQLIEDFTRPLGAEPPLLQAKEFKWPGSNSVDFRDYWKKVDASL